MEQQEWTHIDKKDWGPGPWQDEPDKIQWQDEATGLACLMVRHPTLGHWCGYVGVAEGHPFFKKEYNDIDEDLNVHGGLTFTDSCYEDMELGQGVCHVPSPGEPDDVWWLGFDFMHAGDVAPGTHEITRRWSAEGGDSYKDRAYVERECFELAAQVKEMKK